MLIQIKRKTERNMPAGGSYLGSYSQCESVVSQLAAAFNATEGGVAEMTPDELRQLARLLKAMAGEE